MIDVVLHERYAVVKAHAFQCALQETIAGMVEGNDVAQADALGRGILDMPHVQIQPATIEQEAAIAGRFLVIAIVQVDGAETRDLEDVVLDTDRKRVGSALPIIAADQTTVLGLQSDDAIHKSFKAERTSLSSSNRNLPVAGRLRSMTAASICRAFRYSFKTFSGEKSRFSSDSSSLLSPCSAVFMPTAQVFAASRNASSSGRLGLPLCSTR